MHGLEIARKNRHLEHLPVALGAILDGADVVPLDFVCCASVALSSLIRYVKGHAEGLLVRLSIRLKRTRETQSVKHDNQSARRTTRSSGVEGQHQTVGRELARPWRCSRLTSRRLSLNCKSFFSLSSCCRRFVRMMFA